MRDIVVSMIKRPTAPTQAILGQGSAPGGAVVGLWGEVLRRHSEDHTVDVRFQSGFEMARIPVASSEWSTAKTKPILGGRDLPPVGATVFALMPTGEIESAFILASMLLPLSDKQKTNFLVKDKESEALSIVEGGWRKTYDKAKGDLKIEDDSTFILTIEKSNKKIDILDWNKNEVTIDSNGIKVVDANKNEITLGASGVSVKDKNGNVVDLAAGGATITTTQAKITGGALTVKGSAAPTGAGPFCALPFCLVTGAPHVGPTVTGT